MKENKKLRKARFVALTVVAIAIGTIGAIDAFSAMDKGKWNIQPTETGYNCTPGGTEDC